MCVTIVGIFLAFMLTAVVVFEVVKAILYKTKTILDVFLAVVLVLIALIFPPTQSNIYIKINKYFTIKVLFGIIKVDIKQIAQDKLHKAICTNIFQRVS